MQNSEIRLGFEAASALTLSKKEIKKTIITLLEVFSKFKSPRKIYMAEEIRSLYDEVWFFMLVKMFFLPLRMTAKVGKYFLVVTNWRPRGSKGGSHLFIWISL